MMRFPLRASVTLIVIALAVPMAPPAGAARGTIRCESRNYSRNFCRVDTENNVSLRRQLSNAPCQRNRTWGFDRNGIWVDRGCSADFDFGRNSSNNSNSSSNNNAAIAAGILGALALGAAIGGSQTQNVQPAPPAPPPVAVVPGRPPSWAVGTFQAWDPESRSTVILDVVGDGRVFLRNDSGRLINQGGYRDGSVHWNNGSRSWLAREGPGVMLGDVETGRHFNFRRS
jgi:hypothetical protein